MSIYQQSVVQMSTMLCNLDACLAKAMRFAGHKEVSPDDFVGFRLTPDMRPARVSGPVRLRHRQVHRGRLRGLSR